MIAIPFPTVGAVYELSECKPDRAQPSRNFRPQFGGLQASKLWAVIDRPYSGEWNRIHSVSLPPLHYFIGSSDGFPAGACSSTAIA